MPTLLLTGSSGALSQAIRSYFLERGWNVAGFDRNGDGFEHPGFRFYEIDALDESSVEQAFSQAGADLGSPSMLVATIGGIKPWKPISQTELTDFRFVLELNLTSFFLASKHAIRLMTKAGLGGAIVSIGAEPALHPTSNKAAYVAAKAGVIAMTRVLADEGKSIGITANSLVPTVIRTKANEEWGDNDEIAKWTPPEDIAAMCFHLGSPSARSVTGAVIEMPNRV